MNGKITDSTLYKIVYPLLVYFVLFNLLYSVFNYINANVFGGIVPGLYCAAVAGGLTLAVMYPIYKKAAVYSAKPLFEASKLPKEIIYIISIVALGVVLNLIVSHFPLSEVSESFSKANEYLNNGDIIAKILSNVIIVPALEELVFRGIVCGELEKKFDTAPTVVLSALIFGILHFNWVQMIYAFIIGLLLGFVYDQTHKLWVTYAGHALLNLTVVLITFFTN